MCSTRERTTPRAAAAAPQLPPPSARLSTTGREDPRLKQGEPQDSRHLIPHLSHQELFPASQGLPTYDSHFPLQLPVPRCICGGKLSPHPLTHQWGMNISLPPPFLRLYGIAQSSVWGRGTERTVLGQGMRKDDSQLNEPTIQGRGQRGARPPRPFL